MRMSTPLAMEDNNVDADECTNSSIYASFGPETEPFEIVDLHVSQGSQAGFDPLSLWPGQSSPDYL